MLSQGRGRRRVTAQQGHVCQICHRKQCPMWKAHSVFQALHETVRCLIARRGTVEIALPLRGDAQREQCPRLTEDVAVCPCESQSFFAQRGRSREIAAHLSERRCCEECIDAGFGRGRTSRRQRGLEPLLTLTRLTSRVREREDCPSQPQYCVGVSGAQSPGNSRVQVVSLDGEAFDPGRRTRHDEMWLGLLSQGEVMGRVSRASGAFLPAGRQLLQSELSNRLEHAV